MINKKKKEENSKSRALSINHLHFFSFWMLHTSNTLIESAGCVVVRPDGWVSNSKQFASDNKFILCHFMHTTPRSSPISIDGSFGCMAANASCESDVIVFVIRICLRLVVDELWCELQNWVIAWTNVSRRRIRRRWQTTKKLTTGDCTRLVLLESSRTFIYFNLNEWTYHRCSFHSGF